jgi:pyruvate,water dikinase
MEFAISNSIIHPLALCEPEKITDADVAAEIHNLTKAYLDGKDYFVN